MYLYFLLIRLAALFGHKKARTLLRGQRNTLAQITNTPSPISNAVWFHAASVGEFEQARPLIERLRREQPKQKIILTFFSPSGYEMRKNYDRVDGVYYLPFATRRNAKRFIEALQPKMAIFVKYEFWPAYLRQLKKQNIPTYSICAIFRPGQLFFKPWGKSHLGLLKCFKHIYVQDEASQRLLNEHGIAHCSVAGDTRFDRVKQVQTDQLSHTDDLTPISQFVQNAERVIVAGSTWPKDETLIHQYLTANSAKLILAPHELDQHHLQFIFNLFQGRLVRYSDIISEQNRLSPDSRQNILSHANILVIDTMGLLSRIYQFGHVAYIGGGFGVGIHNTLEAAVWGKPLLFGPNYHHFREAQGLIQAQAARSIKNYNELESALNTALDNYAEIGERAGTYVASELGATDTIYNELFVKN